MKSLHRGFFRQLNRPLEGGLESSYDNVISAVDVCFTNRIQTLQHLWKKCVNRKRDYVEK